MRSAARKPEQDARREPPREDPRARAAGLDAQYEAVLCSLEADHASPDLIFEVIATGRHYAAHCAALERLLAAQYGEDRAFAAGVAFGQSRAAATARVPAPRPGWQRTALKVVRAVVPAGAIGLAAKIWSAHRILAPVTTAAVLSSAATVVSLQTMQTTPDYASTAPHSARGAGVPVPSSSLIARSITRREPKAKAARGLPVIPSPSASPALPAWVPSPPSASPSPSQLPRWIQVAQSADLSAALQVTLTVTARGGTVEWRATCPPDVQLIQGSGTAAPGQPGSLTLGLGAVQDGQLAVTCHVWPGDLAVQVMLPAPLPVPLPSDTAVPVPSPS